MPPATFERALVIRGGALGDFLLTLPVLDSLREAQPQARLEVLAYPGIAALAAAGGKIHAARSIEYAPLAGFFTKGAVLDPALRNYFAGFDLVLSYLYDPDGIFADNLRAAGVRNLVTGPARPTSSSHAIDQLAAPLTQLGVPLARRAVRLDFPAPRKESPLVVLHPGSGSASKNWPSTRWRQLAEKFLAEFAEARVAVAGGEADARELAELRRSDFHERMIFLENLPLRELAGHLSLADLYLGHDTGVSHLAAVAGAPSLLLFGPTDPGVWAPPHDHVRVLCAPGGNLAELAVSTVWAAASRMMQGVRLASAPASGDNPRP